MNDRDVVEEVKARCDIVSLISESVKLRKTGANYVGLCPFHSEKTPSFVVFPSTSNFYCFGCGAGGDALNFVMREENLSFREALETLGKRVGVEIPPYRGRGEEGEYGNIDRERLLSMNTAAARFYRDRLFDERTPEGLRYLTARGLATPIIRRFGIGYAPPGSSPLREHLLSLGYTDEEMEAGCLAGEGRDKVTGEPYHFDFFRARVIFPIFDLSGAVIGFGGRALGDGEPKYLNSRDTAVFKKRRTLFALNFAKKVCAQQIILCEGYMDVIALHRAGFNNAVATLGTAITPDHARLMARYTKSVVICYDADEAGQRAADRAFQILGQVGLDTTILKVEGAKDPDEYLRKNGADAFQALLGGARSRFDFQLERTLAGHDTADPQERVRLSSQLSRTIADYPSAVERDVYTRRAAEALGVPPEALARDVAAARRGAGKKAERERFRSFEREMLGYGERVNPDIARNPGGGAAEEAVLGLLLLRPEFTSTVKGEGLLTPDDFVTDFGRRAFAFLMENGEGAEALLSRDFSADEVGRLTRMKVRRMALTENGEEQLREGAAALRAARERGQSSGEGPVEVEDVLRAIEAKRNKG